jgi:hypothetical protein
VKFGAGISRWVRQWRYKPLILNGVPTPFVLTVTLTFSIKGEVSDCGIAGGFSMIDKLLTRV